MLKQVEVAEEPTATRSSIPQDAAESAGLVYVHDDREPGITRRRKAARAGPSARPTAPRSRTPRRSTGSASSRSRPPIRDVWICPDPRGHIQATGRDAKGRKQYRYHPAFREVRDSAKYEHVTAFAEALPQIRATVKTPHGRCAACRARRCWRRSSTCSRRR